MNVTLCSIFRNATPYLERYFSQVCCLAAQLAKRGDCLQTVWCEGDSTDDTWAQLIAGYHNHRRYLPYQIELLTHDHGGADYGSIVHPERFANLAKVCNEVWRHIPQSADVVIWCESDLVWRVYTMLTLIDNLSQYPAVAPMVMLERDGYVPNFFYDTWAYRKDGKHIMTTPPYFAGWDMTTPIQVDSAGSVLAMRGDIARAVTWPAEDVIVGLCRNIYEQGGSVWLEPAAKVIHL